MVAALLPVTSGVFEKAVAETVEKPADIGNAVTDLHGLKYIRPLNITVSPWLLVEYGLGGISKYFDTYEDLIDTGRVWQRLRGTAEALSTALSWLIYPDIQLEDSRKNRRRWHLYQVDMGAVPAAAQEAEVLTDAEYLADLSDPARSVFFRGFSGYNVRGLEFSNFKFGKSLWGDSSGRRLPGGSVKWSHGRVFNKTGVTTGQDWSAIGLGFANGDPIGWNDGFSWSTPGLTWGGIADAAALRTYLLQPMKAYIGFFDAAGAPIGYALVVENVLQSGIHGLQYRIRTGFGDGYQKTTATMAIVLGGQSAAGIPLYKKWLEPDEITFPDAEFRFGATAFIHTFMATMRDRIVFTVGIS